MNTAITDCGKHGLEPTETQGGSFLRVGESRGLAGSA